MKALRAQCNRIYESEWGRMALGAAAALALYAAARIFQSVITFYDNDDLNIAWALAGYRGGKPSFAHPFLNPVTASTVSALYTLFPGVPWWYAVQTACLLAGVAVTVGCLFKLAARNGVSFAVPAVLTVLLCGGVYYYAIAQVMFTLSSTVLGMAACALVLAVDGDGQIKRQRTYRRLSVVMLSVSLLIRQSSGICAACFYFGCIAYRAIAAGWAKRQAGQSPRPAGADLLKAPWRWGVTALCAATVAALLFGVNAWGRANQHQPGFLAFENARAEYMDYPHDLHYENRALYDSIGWEEPLQGLVDAWFYMDARVNADTLKRASEQSHANSASATERMARAWDDVFVFLGKYPIARYLGGMACCAFAALLVAGLFGKRKLPVLFGCILLLGALLLAGYLFWRGRMNLRTWMTVLFPAILTLLLLSFDAYAGGGRGRRAALYAILCGILLPGLFFGYRIFRTVVSYDSRAALAEANAVVDYAMAHPNNVYIRDVYAGNNYDALRVFAQDKPVNLIDWGGCDMYTRARRMQWAINGYQADPYADVFFDPNVYYVCNPQGPYLPMLDEYMRISQGARGYEIVETLESGLAIVRFLQ